MEYMEEGKIEDIKIDFSDQINRLKCRQTGLLSADSIDIEEVIESLRKKLIELKGDYTNLYYMGFIMATVQVDPTINIAKPINKT